VQWTSLTLKTADVKDEQELANRALPELGRMLTEVRHGGRQAFGSAVFKGRRQAVVVVAAFTSRLELEPVPTRVEPGVPIVLRGRPLGLETDFNATITRGANDSAKCEPVPASGAKNHGPASPRFSAKIVSPRITSNPPSDAARTVPSLDESSRSGPPGTPA
jgi:hypothetical protein